MKRVCILSGLQIFPPESGGQWRSASLAMSFARQGYQVEIFSLTGRKKEYLDGKSSSVESPHPGITEYVYRSRLYGALQLASYRLNLPPLWMTALLSVYLPRELRARILRSDFFVLDFPYASPALGYGSQRSAIHLHNVEHKLWERDWFRKTFIAPLVRRIENRAAEKADVILGCAEEDILYFGKHLDQRKKIHHLPNGADPSRFERDEILRHQIRARWNITNTENVFLFSGSQYGPNRTAYEFLRRFAFDNYKALEEMKVVFLVVGSVAASSGREGQLITTGKVAQVEPYFSAADYAINPVTEGSGSNVKMFEFIAARLPILSTSFGARGLNLDPAEDYSVFDRANLLADLRAFLASDAKDKLARSAYRKHELRLTNDHLISELL